MNLSDSERIDALETRLAYQEHAGEELGKQMYEMQTALDRLSAQVKALSGRLKDALEGSGDPMPSDQRPPHY